MNEQNKTVSKAESLSYSSRMTDCKTIQEVATVIEGVAAYAELERFHGIGRELRQSAHELRKLCGGYKALPVRAVITQGDKAMLTGTILGLAPGTSDTFFVTPVDVNGNADALPAGSPVPTILADDSTVTVTTAADGLSAVVAAAAGAVVSSSFNLNWAATYTKPDGTTASITGTCNVPIIAPPALLPVSGVFSQGSPAAGAVTAAAFRGVKR